jgi:hypothetical protein
MISHSPSSETMENSSTQKFDGSTTCMLSHRREPYCGLNQFLLKSMLLFVLPTYRLNMTNHPYLSLFDVTQISCIIQTVVERNISWLVSHLALILDNQKLSLDFSIGTVVCISSVL